MKEKRIKGEKKVLIFAVSAVMMLLSFSSALVFAENSDSSSSEIDVIVQENDTSKSDIQTDNSDDSGEKTVNTDSQAAANASIPAALPSSSSNNSDTQSVSLAVGTKFTSGDYIYMVKGSNKVAIKGFASGVTKSTVDIPTTVTYNNVKYNVVKIGTEAFKGKTCIKKVIIRKNVTDIGKRAFIDCKNITKVRMKTGVKIIRKGAFRNCTKLNIVNITSTILTDIKENAFKNIKSGSIVNVMNDPVRKLMEAAVSSKVTVNMM